MRCFDSSITLLPRAIGVQQGGRRAPPLQREGLVFVGKDRILATSVWSQDCGAQMGVYAEVHWYEAHGIGMKEIKIKRLLP